SRRFCVFSSTPSPALEMYSSLAHCRTTSPSSLSRCAWSFADCEASSRPARTTMPGPPSSIVTIAVPIAGRARGPPGEGFAERHPALALLLRVLVLPRIHQPAHEMQAQPTGTALLDRLVHIRVGRLGHVERLGAPVDERDPHGAIDAGELERDGTAVRAAV